jgi:hypothetical protein
MRASSLQQRETNFFDALILVTKKKKTLVGGETWFKQVPDLW